MKATVGLKRDQSGRSQLAKVGAGVVTAILFLVALAVLVLMPVEHAVSGELPRGHGLKVLAPIQHGALTVYPIVTSTTHDTREFLTLDEGVRSGEVVVSEAGAITPLMRRRGRPIPQEYREGARVNQLVLVNNSGRPLLLLAGEIVTGGKQDRVVGKDRIIPANSDPVDLGVFCVEPGRWQGASAKFDTATAPMAQPSVRRKAMADANQQEVWAEVARSRDSAVRSLAAAPASGNGGGVAGGVASMSSYARVMDNKAVAQKVDEVARPMQQSFEAVLRQLRSQNAVGVVVAVRGEIVWADVFASTSLLEKYWPKLSRSYAAETLGAASEGHSPSLQSAQTFLNTMEGNRETVESEPGIYRHSQIDGAGFKVFELTSLLPKTGFDVHVAKMAQ